MKPNNTVVEFKLYFQENLIYFLKFLRFKTFNHRFFSQYKKVLIFCYYGCIAASLYINNLLGNVF